MNFERPYVTILGSLICLFLLTISIFILNIKDDDKTIIINKNNIQITQEDNLNDVRVTSNNTKNGTSFLPIPSTSDVISLDLLNGF